MPSAGPRLFGRELDLAETAVAVSVRDGVTIVANGPTSDADAALTRINVIECADLDAAIAFGSGMTGDSGRTGDIPYLLLAWIAAPPAALGADPTLIAEVESWRRKLEAEGRYVMGSSLGGIEAAATQRLRNAQSVAADMPFNVVDDRLVAVEVVLAGDRRQAIELAAAHPLARTQAIEVRPFLPGD